MKLPAIACLGLLVTFTACGDNTRTNTDNNSPPHVTNPPPGTNQTPGNPTNPTPNQNQDQQLASRVRQAIVDDTALSPMAQDLQVTAMAGTVTLRGTVQSQSDKDALGDKAKGVTGVTSVVNNLTVKS